MRQVNIGKWWGLFKLLGQHVTSYVQYINFVLIAITAYSTTIGPYSRSYGFELPSWLFGLIMLLLLIGLFTFEYTLSFPSFFSVWNEQWWNHDNPMKTEMAALRAEITELKTLISQMQRPK